MSATKCARCEGKTQGGDQCRHPASCRIDCKNMCWQHADSYKRYSRGKKNNSPRGSCSKDYKRKTSPRKLKVSPRKPKKVSPPRKVASRKVSSPRKPKKVSPPRKVASRKVSSPRKPLPQAPSQPKAPSVEKPALQKSVPKAPSVEKPALRKVTSSENRNARIMSEDTKQRARIIAYLKEVSAKDQKSGVKFDDLYAKFGDKELEAIHATKRTKPIIHDTLSRMYADRVIDYAPTMGNPKYYWLK